jgi:hypothetical protein
MTEKFHTCENTNQELVKIAIPSPKNPNLHCLANFQVKKVKLFSSFFSFVMIFTALTSILASGIVQINAEEVVSGLTMFNPVSGSSNNSQSEAIPDLTATSSNSQTSSQSISQNNNQSSTQTSSQQAQSSDQNNAQVCVNVQTVGQNLNNQSDIKTFGTNCLPDGYEKITISMATATILRLSKCQPMRGSPSIYLCEEIDWQAVNNNLSCPKGSYGRENRGCLIDPSLWGDTLSSMIRLTQNTTQQTQKDEQKNNPANSQPTVSLLERINVDCKPEADKNGKMVELTEQMCNDRRTGYTGPFLFQRGGSRGTRNCYYVGSVLNKSYGCDTRGYLKMSCDLIGRYANIDPKHDPGAPDCTGYSFVAQTQEADIINRGISSVEKTKVDGVDGLIATGLMPNPRNFTECFEPTVDKNGFETSNAYCTTGASLRSIKSYDISWINIGSLNAFAAAPATSITKIPKTGIAAKTSTTKTAATAAIASTSGTFNIEGLNLLGIDCLFVSASGETEGCLVDRLVNFLKGLAIPLAMLVLIWAGYQYFIGGVDGKSNGRKAIETTIIGLIIITGADFIIGIITDVVPQAKGGEFRTQPIIDMLLAIKNFAVALSTMVAILVIIWGGYKYFFSGLDWQKEGGLKAIKNAVLGLAVILIANSIAETTASFTVAITSNPDNGFITAFNQIFEPILTDITSILLLSASLVAVLVIVWGGYKYFFSGLDMVKKDGLENIRNGVIGLVTVILAQSIVGLIKSTVLPEPAASGSILNINTTSISGFIVSITNGVLVPISTAFAVFFMIMGGFYWITSDGDQKRVDKARKSILNAIIGLVIVILAVSIIQIVRFLAGGLNINP